MDWGMYNMFISCKIKFFTMIFLIAGFLGLISVQLYAKDNVKYVGKVNAYTANSTYEKRWVKYRSDRTNEFGKYIKNDRRFDSLNKELYLMVTYNEKTNISLIKIRWKRFEKIIREKNNILGVYWRPGTYDFMFVKEYPLEGDEGDFGECTINYAGISLSQKGINVKKLIHGSPQLTTSISWSSDGKYFAYSEGDSFQIKNFITGELWVAKSIILDHKTDLWLLFLDEFLWTDHDRKIIFFWKDHPFHEEPSGIGVLDLKPFGLN
jgi:hypothetical protein